MPYRKRPAASKLPLQMAALQMAVPQVVAHRVTQMALAGARPSANDRAEFNLMVAEKQTAFMQSWAAMWMEGLRSQQRMAWSLATAWRSPKDVCHLGPAALQQRLMREGAQVLSHGLAPVERKATANAKRLSRNKVRR